MKQILTIAFILVGSVTLAQDTLYIMIKQQDVIEFDNSTMNMIDRFSHTTDFEVRVGENQTLLLHLFDDKRRFRDVLLKFDDGIISKETYNSKSNVLFSDENWVGFTVNVSKARLKK